MQIKQITITIADLIKNFKCSDDGAVTGYGGRLNIRPPYQRNFIYTSEQEKEVIHSIFKGYPINVMYWNKNKPDENGEESYELIDGQQRTLSICHFSEGMMYVCLDGALRSFVNLSDEERERFLGYKLTVFVLEDGTWQDKLDWFRIINIAGLQLNKQELRNAIYTGSWITCMKSIFASSNCKGKQWGGSYLNGSPDRQDYVETVLEWISDGKIEEYMAEHQRDKDAEKEWQYFYDVISWVNRLFTNYRKEMKGLPWGKYYNLYHKNYYSPSDLESRIGTLMMDDDISKKKGIYPYLLSGEEKHLSLRAFSAAMKREAYERQGGVCPCCHKRFDIDQMEGDHITPWSQGGKTTADNCQMLCKNCNRTKSSK